MHQKLHLLLDKMQVPTFHIQTIYLFSLLVEGTKWKHGECGHTCVKK